MDPIPNLMEAARAGNIDGLYYAIKKKPNVLKEIGEIQFVNTPLHEAASAGQSNFAMEMIRLAPSFGRKLNPDGLSPLDLAVINNHYETVKRLVSFDGELVCVKGKEGLTPLHRAAESDDKIGCLIELLLTCPPSIKDLTIRDETALHVAMKSSSSAVTFNFLYEWVSRAGGRWLLQEKDVEGKSPEAHHKEQPKTPEPFCQYLRRILLMYMVWSQRHLTMEMRSVVLVVAVLIATASFPAILSPPSGLENHNKNSAQREENNGFLLSNSMAFAASVVVITTVLPLTLYNVILHASLFFMTNCYGLFLELVPIPWLVHRSIQLLNVYLACAYILKAQLWCLKTCTDKSVDLSFLPSRWKQNLRCLHQVEVLIA